MLTQLLLLLGLCHQVDVSNPKISTTLVCEYDDHNLTVWFYLDGKNQARLDGVDLFIIPEPRHTCIGPSGYIQEMHR